MCSKGLSEDGKWKTSEASLESIGGYHTEGCEEVINSNGGESQTLNDVY